MITTSFRNKKKAASWIYGKCKNTFDNNKIQQGINLQQQNILENMKKIKSHLYLTFSQVARKTDSLCFHFIDNRRA